MKSLPHSKAKDVFSHLLAIVTLYVGVVSIITLYFQYINIRFPDALQFYYLGALDTIRQSMAALVVVWPVYILMSWLIHKDLLSSKEKNPSTIRKWLLYLTLFLTAITIIVDLVTLVNYFLNGEITTRFILKVLVILITAGAIFSYYLWDLRHEVTKNSPIPKKVAIISSVVVCMSIALGFVFVGSPAQQRLVRLDEQRVNNLSTIQSEVISYYDQKKVLPPTLESLRNSLTGFVAPTDPVTHQPYEYVVKDGLKFDLCATFGAASVTDASMATPAPYPYYDGRYSYGQNWTHGAGRVCFERTIDPTLFPSKNP